MVAQLTANQQSWVRIQLLPSTRQTLSVLRWVAQNCVLASEGRQRYSIYIKTHKNIQKKKFQACNLYGKKVIVLIRPVTFIFVYCINYIDTHHAQICEHTVTGNTFFFLFTFFMLISLAINIYTYINTSSYFTPLG